MKKSQQQQQQQRPTTTINVRVGLAIGNRPEIAVFRVATTWDAVLDSLGWILEDAPAPRPEDMLNAEVAESWAIEGIKYVVGLDTETCRIRKDNKEYGDDFLRQFPSTLQIGARTRVLIVPTNWLVIVRQQPIPPAFAAFMARDDILWSGVGLSDDHLFMSKAGMPFVQDHCLDSEIITRLWYGHSSLEELAYRVAGFGPGPLHQTGILSISPPGSLSRAPLRPLPDLPRGECEKCDATHIPVYMSDPSSLIGVANGKSFPLLAVGWKTKDLSISEWDIDPCQWTPAMAVYAAMDGLASYHVGIAFHAYFNHPAGRAFEHIPIPPKDPAYRPAHVRAFPTSPLENMRRALAYHANRCRERNAAATLRSALAHLKKLGRIRGPFTTAEGFSVAAHHLVAAGILRLAPNTDPTVAAAAAEAAFFDTPIAHVCHSAPIPLIPIPTSLLSTPPDGFVLWMWEKRPPMARTEELVLDGLIEIMVDWHPYLHGCDVPRARETAARWIAAIGGIAGIEPQARAIMAETRRTMAAGKAARHVKMREGPTSAMAEQSALDAGMPGLAASIARARAAEETAVRRKRLQRQQQLLAAAATARPASSQP
ncbi:hypothetical protein BC828DRAFT_390133 [Blastocladiella britannica]|nr:hypothetical protein BC828DRAFT_390133 [Blastocladiella britannica]